MFINLQRFECLTPFAHDKQTPKEANKNKNTHTKQTNKYIKQQNKMHSIW
jgi:hypothetical protein